MEDQLQEIEEKKKMIAGDRRELQWIEEVLEKKKKERNVLVDEIYELEYSMKELEKITMNNILKRLKEDNKWIYQRKKERIKMTKAKYEEMFVEIEILKQKRNRIKSHMQREKQKLDQLQQELKAYPEAQDMLKEQEKQKEILFKKAEELKREIAFAEQKIVLSEEARRELIGEAKREKAYNIARGGLDIISISLLGVDLDDILDSTFDPLRDNIKQKERDISSMTSELSMLKSQLEEIESKLEEYN